MIVHLNKRKFNIYVSNYNYLFLKITNKLSRFIVFDVYDINRIDVQTIIKSVKNSIDILKLLNIRMTLQNLNCFRYRIHNLSCLIKLVRHQTCINYG